MIDKMTAIKSLLPTAQIALADDVITWVVEPEIKPTDAEIDAELARLRAEYNAKEYQRKRALEYPDFRDYLDGIVKGNQSQIDSYIAACQAVKAKYPKG